MIKSFQVPGHPEAFRNGQGDAIRDFCQGGDAQADAARSLHVPTPRINEMVRERRGITADTALRLARYFGGDAQSWLNLQAVYELRQAEITSARKIDREVPVRAEVTKE